MKTHFIRCWQIAVGLAVLCGMSSCATIFNSKTTKTTIFTNKPASIVTRNDSSRPSVVHRIELLRGKGPERITMTGDSVTKTIDLKSQTSAMTWLDLVFWPLLIVDNFSPKSFGYPARIYVDMDDDKPEYLTYSAPAPHQNSIVKLTPLKLLGLVNPSVEMSYERRTGKSFASQVMLSPLLAASVFGSDGKLNWDIKGFRAAIEERWYLNGAAPANRYLALEIDYLKTRYNTVAGFNDAATIPFPGNSPAYIDTFGVKKFTIGFAFKFGYQKLIERFVIDYYIGLGAKYREATHTGRTNFADVMTLPRHPNIWYETNREGNFWTVLIPMNIRIGWIF